MLLQLLYFIINNNFIINIKLIICRLLFLTMTQISPKSTYFRSYIKFTLHILDIFSILQMNNILVQYSH